jgi:hypothetical protein
MVEAVRSVDPIRAAATRPSRVLREAEVLVGMVSSLRRVKSDGEEIG